MPTFWKNIRSYDLAVRVAEITERLTGDRCVIRELGPRSFRVLRRVQLHPVERWIEA